MIQSYSEISYLDAILILGLTFLESKQLECNAEVFWSANNNYNGICNYNSINTGSTTRLNTISVTLNRTS